MLFTEAEAMKKWCPLINSACMASRCMAWRVVTRVHRRRTELWSKSKNCKVYSAFGDDADWRPIAEDANLEVPPALATCSAFRAQHENQ